MQLREPQGVIFDYGDTIMHEESYRLLDGYTRLLQFALDPGDHSPQELLDFTTALAREIDVFKRQTHLEFKLQTFFKLAFDRLGVRFSLSYSEMEREFWNAAVLHRPFEGIYDVLDHLESRGIRRGILSNVSFAGEVLLEDLARFDLARRFSFLVASSDYGIRKPNPQIFRVALAKIGLDPGAVWFVGDRLDNDVQGAIQVGMTPVWYNWRGLANTQYSPCLEVRTMAELSRMLKAL
jgi:putative hydrolase of the HAD superfamily